MRKLRTLSFVLIAACVVIAACAKSDIAVTTEVKAKLIADPTVAAGEIEVSTEKGVVTLKGNIDSAASRDRALELARRTPGVVRVNDMIEVRQTEARGDAPDAERTVGEALDDAGITLRVKQRLLDDPVVGGLKIDVDTRAGVVYLTGNVSGDKERDQAIKLAKETDGVKDVQANLSLGKG